MSMRGTWFVFPLLLALAGCNFHYKVGGQVTTTVDSMSDANGHKVHNRLVFTNYVMRAAIATNPVTAAYVTVKNEGDQADRLVSASCGCSQSATLHAMVMQGQDMVMEEPKGGFPVAPGQVLVFKPGGNHIMLSGLTDPPRDGGTETLTLHFERAGDVKLTMPVSATPQGQ